jgi:hypothetical protein
MVGRLVWVKEFLSSNLSNPKIKIELLGNRLYLDNKNYFII